MKTNKTLELMLKKHKKRKIKVEATKVMIGKLNSNVKKSVETIVMN